MNRDFEESVSRLREETCEELELQQRTKEVLRLLLDVNDSSRIRPALEGFETDWSLSPKVRLAMFFQIFRNNDVATEDFHSFSVFLGLFYEEMGEWAQALSEYAMVHGKS